MSAAHTSTTLKPPPYEEAVGNRRDVDAVYVDPRAVMKPPGRVVVVDSRPYYGIKSGMCSLLLCLVFPPLSLVPICAPCDSADTVVVVTRKGRRVRRRQVIVRVPTGTPPGTVLSARPRSGTSISFVVPEGLGPGDALAINYDC